MKTSFIAVGCLIALGSSAYAMDPEVGEPIQVKDLPINSENLKMVFGQGHVTIFSKDNLVKQKITPQEKDAWLNTIGVIRDFIKTNAPKKALWADELYTTEAQLLEGINALYDHKKGTETKDDTAWFTTLPITLKQEDQKIQQWLDALGTEKDSLFEKMTGKSKKNLDIRGLLTFVLSYAQADVKRVLEECKKMGIK